MVRGGVKAGWIAPRERTRAFDHRHPKPETLIQRCYIVYSADQFCFILFVVRIALVKKDEISIAHHTHGRVL